MIHVRVVYQCDEPGCRNRFQMRFRAGLYVQEIQPPDGWGEDKDLRILCPKHYKPAPSGPNPLLEAYVINGKSYCSPKSLLSLMTTLQQDAAKGEVIHFKLPKEEK